MKPALIIGHAGHELRVLKFIELFKPMVFIITDGSGSNGISRKESTRKIFEHYDCEISDVFCRFTDKAIYEHILSGNIQMFYELKERIRKELLRNDIDFVFGDACEGFSPTHDLCRYIINSIIETYRKKLPDWGIKNYDFLLDNSPCFGAGLSPHITIQLSDEDKRNRDKLIAGYPEIKCEIEFAKQKFGEADFDYECLREVKNHDLKTWATNKPFYESYAEKKVAEGTYKDIITFNHLAHIVKNL